MAGGPRGSLGLSSLRAVGPPPAALGRERGGLPGGWSLVSCAGAKPQQTAEKEL